MRMGMGSLVIAISKEGSLPGNRGDKSHIVRLHRQYEPRLEISNNVVFATSKASDQGA